ncbi:MAG: hypothetical protein U1E76_27420 [Planctomycetota bacterium]
MTAPQVPVSGSPSDRPEEERQAAHRALLDEIARNTAVIAQQKSLHIFFATVYAAELGDLFATHSGCPQRCACYTLLVSALAGAAWAWWLANRNEPPGARRA